MLAIHSRCERYRGVHTNLVNDNSKRLVNRIVGLRLVEERESVLERCIGRQLAIKVSLRAEVSV